jgi:hypothetical protein
VSIVPQVNINQKPVVSGVLVVIWAILEIQLPLPLIWNAMTVRLDTLTTIGGRTVATNVQMDISNHSDGNTGVQHVLEESMAPAPKWRLQIILSASIARPGFTSPRARQTYVLIAVSKQMVQNIYPMRGLSLYLNANPVPRVVIGKTHPNVKIAQQAKCPKS